MEEHVLELLPAYALGCLDKEDTESVSRHLDGCETCRTQLIAYQSVSDRLGLAAPMVDPPAGLKSRVMERVEAENKLLSVVSHRGRAFKGIFRPLPFAWGLVGLFIIIALVMSNLLLWRQVSKLQSVSQKPNFQVVALAGTNHAPEARGMLVISASGQSGTLIVDGLPALDVDHQYQLWLIIDDQRTNGGIFSVSRVGYASMWISSPRPLADYTAFGITVEPKGGSPGPTGDKVLGGQM